MSKISLSLQKTLAITKKNVKIYYLKPPVLIFGLIFPLFLFLAFAFGRDLSAGNLVPALLGVTILFTASAVGPLITPWERQFKTYERLFSCPLSLTNIVLGDVLSGFFYGGFICLVPLLVGILFFETTPVHLLLFIPIMLAALLCFSALGSLLASMPTEQPSSVMMLSNLVRLPLLFISGVFIPIVELPYWGKTVAMISPLTYTMELIRWSFGQEPSIDLLVNTVMLIVFTVLFLYFAQLTHRIGHNKKFS